MVEQESAYLRAARIQVETLRAGAERANREWRELECALSYAKQMLGALESVEAKQAKETPDVHP